MLRVHDLPVSSVVVVVIAVFVVVVVVVLCPSSFNATTVGQK
jgi:hypothetical protein